MKVLNKIPGHDPLDSIGLGYMFKLHQVPLLLEKDNWELVDDIDDAQLIFILNDEFNTPLTVLKQVIKPHHIVIDYSLFHIDDYFYDRVWINNKLACYANVTDRVIFVHCNAANMDGKHVYNDHIFNRQKLYCTQYSNEYELHSRVWTTFTTANVYALSTITKTMTNKFLCLSRVYGPTGSMPPRMQFRKELKEILEEDGNGYISSPETGNILYPNGLDSKHDFMLNRGGTWLPAADHFYNNSYISIYVETLTTTDPVRTRLISEKTYDPLIKGNFILPFSYQGFIQDVIAMGFKLPSWIDYSYDEIGDPYQRFAAFKHSVSKVLKYSVSDLHRMYERDKHILTHNRNVFFERPYDPLYEKIVRAIEENGFNRNL